MIEVKILRAALRLDDLHNEIKNEILPLAGHLQAELRLPPKMIEALEAFGASYDEWSADCRIVIESKDIPAESAAKLIMQQPERLVIDVEPHWISETEGWEVKVSFSDGSNETYPPPPDAEALNPEYDSQKLANKTIKHYDLQVIHP